MVGSTAFKARQPWCALIGRVSSVMTTSAPAKKREKIRLMRYWVAELLRAAHSRERQSNDVQSMPYLLPDI